MNNPLKFTDPTGKFVDISITGANNSSLTLKTDIIDLNIQTDIDFGGNIEIADLTNIAIGIERGVSGNAAFLGGAHIGAYEQSVLFLGGDHAGYWYDYDGIQTGFSVMSAVDASVGGSQSLFLAIDNSNSLIKPQSYSGLSSYMQAGGGIKALAGLTLNAGATQSIDGAWTSINLGMGKSLGLSVGMFSGGTIELKAGFSKTRTLSNPNNVKPTNERSSIDKFTNWTNHLIKYTF